MSKMTTISRVQWGNEHPVCFLCGHDWSRRPNPDSDCLTLSTHEIVRGVHRAEGVKLPAAWMRLCCPRCHDIVAGWPIVRQLAMKKRFDIDCYDRQAVNIARGRQPDAITEAEVDAKMEKLIGSRASQAGGQDAVSQSRPG